ncbi:radical SAM protein [Marinilabilia rubra]|uniref:Radical SAM protein n=1 Tax=Marinilabilia rubra TaxID=2162893 RepID=A0A2U2B4K5_9BACT|nr:radical SAM protein [Marinilabilia rubra]PWD98000.1 radical SAM protein [Marinilabilia rubra]
MTFYTLLRLHQRIKSRRLKLLGLLAASKFGLRHLSIRIDPVLGCNLACRMCSFSSAEFRKKQKGALTKEEMEGIARVLFPRSFQLMVGCGAEPTKHPGYLELFKLAKKYGVPDIGIVTNGQTLKRHDIEVMKETGVREITLSVHGVKKGTYEKFMTGASYEKFLEVMANIKQIREQSGDKKKPAIRINYTVNSENLEELKDFFEVFRQLPVDVLQIRPIMDIGGKYRKQLTEDLIPKYNETIRILEEECGQRNIRLLANTMDASYDKPNHDSDIAGLVYTYISPKTAGQLDVNWQQSSFSEYRKSDKWIPQLWKVFLRKNSEGNGLDKSLKYEDLS